MNKGRLEAFTDAIVAIAATIMVLDRGEVVGILKASM